mgnify:CR=1 FL=1
MTAYVSWRCLIAAANFCGSSGSRGLAGNFVLTWQNLHALVQVSPMIMNVAVPCDQHSAMFGHLDSWQTVWRLNV